MEKVIKVTVAPDSFEDKNTQALVDYVKYSVKIDNQEFDLYPLDESKPLLKYLFDKKEYFKDVDNKEEKLHCISTADGIVYKLEIFGKLFVLVPKRAQKQLLDFLVENVA